jgi:branched-chain amino acid transport system substrate-binding protein
MQVKRIRRAVALLAALATVLALVACGSDDSDESSASGGQGGGGKPLTIGFAIGKTGYIQQFDVPYRRAAELAIEDINAKGGILGRKLQAVEADNKSKPEESGRAALEVLDQGAELVVISGDFDVGAPAAVEAQKQNKIGYSAGAGSTKFGPEGIGPLAFTMAGAAFAQGAIMAEYGAKEKSFKRAYVVLDTLGGDFSKQACDGFAARFEQLNGKGSVVGKDTFSQDDASVAAQVTRLKSLSTQPDVVMICSYMPGAANFMRQMRAAGINTPIFGEQDFDGDSWKNAAPGISNVYYCAVTSIYGDDPDEAVNELYARYEDKFGDPPPNGVAVQGYAVLQAFQKAAEEAKSTDGDKVANVLQGFTDVPLLVGSTSYNEKYHLRITPEMRIMEVQDGKTSFLKTWQPEVVPGITDGE